MKPLPINAIATVEFFTFKGDGVREVKVKVSNDIPNSINPALREHMSNIQFGVFYQFLSNEEELAEVGRIFRAGMMFAQRNNQPPPPNDRGPNKDPEPDPLPTDDEGIKDMVDKLIDED
jgi:hypothetical protein